MVKSGVGLGDVPTRTTEAIRLGAYFLSIRCMVFPDLYTAEPIVAPVVDLEGGIFNTPIVCVKSDGSPVIVPVTPPVPPCAPPGDGTTDAAATLPE